MIYLYVLAYLCLSLFDASIYQQNRYQYDRYLQSLSFKQMGNACIMSAGYMLYRFLCQTMNAFEIEFIGTLIFIYLIYKVYVNHKNQMPLKFTKRMLRLFALIGCFMLVIFTLLTFFSWMGIVIHGLLVGFHAFAFIGFIRLSLPMEQYFRKLIALKAKEKLAQMNCSIIGITGSYGKTSVKNLVNDLLSHVYSTCPTPYSYNNEMGISKTILENLKDHHEIFICEMGADHLHEIEDLCALVHPQIGIVTSVGPQHLSTFGSMENILHEKMQLIEALPENGIGFINADNSYIKEHDVTPNCKIVTVGLHTPADITASNIRCNAQGSQFHVSAFGHEMDCSIQLLGEHNVFNCLFAIGAAMHFKLEPSLIQNALSLCRPVPHRLELKPFFDAVLIDNAYNSNPDSAYKALQVLAMMPNRHFLITPGFLDLGEHQDYYSTEFGKQMIGICDVVILVGKCCAIKESLLAHGFDENQLFNVSSMHEAIQLASVFIQPNDTVLIENDIPESLAQH